MRLFIHGDTPKSSIYSIFIGCNILNHPFWAISIYGNLHVGQSIVKTIRDSYDTWIQILLKLNKTLKMMEQLVLTVILGPG